jgi:hypothetical protein
VFALYSFYFDIGPWCADLLIFVYAILEQMGRTWMHGTLFTPEYIDGVNEFMSFINRKFSEDEKILCPCTRCHNQNYQHQPLWRSTY